MIKRTRGIILKIVSKNSNYIRVRYYNLVFKCIYLKIIIVVRWKCSIMLINRNRQRTICILRFVEISNYTCDTETIQILYYKVVQIIQTAAC